MQEMLNMVMGLVSREMGGRSSMQETMKYLSGYISMHKMGLSIAASKTGMETRVLELLKGKSSTAFSGKAKEIEFLRDLCNIALDSTNALITVANTEDKKKMKKLAEEWTKKINDAAGKLKGSQGDCQCPDCCEERKKKGS